MGTGVTSLPSSLDYLFKDKNYYTTLSFKFQVLFLFFYEALNGDPYENRTRVTAVKGRCLNRLTNGPYVMLFSLRQYL